MTNETMTSTSETATSARALLNNLPTDAEKAANDKPRVARAPRVVAKAEPTGPVQPKPMTAKDAADPRKVAAFIKAMREYNEALKASQPRGTKQPVMSDAIKALFFAEPGISNEAVQKKAAAKLGVPLLDVKLVTIRTFRGDAVNTFKNAAAAGMLTPAGKKWLDSNAKKAGW